MCLEWNIECLVDCTVVQWSLSLTVFATNQTRFVTMFVQSINVMSPNFKNYTVRVQLSPGVYRFTVTANNSRHLEVLKKLMYTFLCMGMDRIESLKIQFNYSIFIGLCCLNFISLLTTSHTTTGSINPTSTKMLYLLLLLLYSSV